MKKLTTLLLSACILITLLTGCSSKVVEIEEHNWKYSTIQNRENGQVIYCSTENKKLYEDAEVLDIWCSADDGILLISNNNTQETWSFTYSLNSKSSNSCLYDVRYSADNEVSGMATVGITDKANENDEYTLIITIDDYVLNFAEELKNS